MPTEKKGRGCAHRTLEVLKGKDGREMAFCAACPRVWTLERGSEGVRVE